MKRAKKTLALLLATILCLSLTGMNVSAASSKQDGLEVTLETDKAQYSKNEQITATLTVTNTNDESVSNITMESLVPAGYSFADNTEAMKQVESLDTGESVSMTVTYVAEATNEGNLSDGNDNGSGNTGNSDSINSDNNNGNSSNKDNTQSSGADVQTGDNANVVFWIVVAVIAGGVIVVAIAARKKKGGKKLMSLFLCLAMVGTLVPLSTIRADAASIQRNILLQEKVSVEDNELILEASVDYELSDGVTDPIDQTDTTDTDNDSVPDWVEEEFGADSAVDDTDGDGISDYDEIMILLTDPTKSSTDEDGVSDAEKDADNDGISNIEELKKGTNPMSKDSDGDGLSDPDEYLYGTDPVNADTDGDGAEDGWEVQFGFDPLTPNSKFNVTTKSENEDSVTASVDIDLSGEQVTSLSIEPEENTTLFPDTIPGYMGKAYDFSVDGSFETATISFEFDPTSIDSNAQPTIYYYNEDEQELEPLDTVINNGIASATVSHFSTYILINRTLYEQSYEWEDVWDNEANYTGVEIVFVIDDSGSMGSNDSTDERLSVACDLIDHLPSDSKIGIVQFASSSTVLTSELTDNRDTAKAYLTTEYFKSSGGTHMYSAINNAFDLFENTGDSILRMMVVLTDGATSDSSKHDSTISAAVENNIRIYTVGLGSSTSYFNSYLMPLAENTNGEFYLASDAEQLSAIYDDINKKIDIETDSDADGIPDYYEDHMVAFNGTKIPLDKNNPDTDGDGLPDGEEILVNLKYNEDQTKVIISGKYNSNPTLVDSDSDGVNDPDDTAPLKKGLADGITGRLNLISCYNSEDAGWTSGHVFFVYTSYIKDSLDFSTLAYGWSKTDKNTSWSWDNLQKDEPLQSNYSVNVDESVAIGNGAFTGGWFGTGNSSGSSGGSSNGSGSGGESSENSTGSGSVSDCNGVCYNMEVYKYLNPDIGYTYAVNTYLSEDITEEQLKELVAYCSKDSVNYWNLIHNCATVACEAWNLISDTQVNPYSDDFFWGKIATPKGLKINLRTIDGSKENYSFVGEFQ